MEKLYDMTMTQVTDFYVRRISENKNISKSLAKKLFLNALLHDWLINEVEYQIDFLLGINNKSDD